MSEDVKFLVENPYHSARFKPARKGKKGPKLLAVVHQSGCTGCEICIQGCPVDSIELVLTRVGIMSTLPTLESS